MLYSRGFSSIYGEWETTAEAKEMNRTFSESLRFPAPDAPVRIVVKKRDAKNVFRDVWTLRRSIRRTSSSRAVRRRRRRARCSSCTRAAIPRQKLDLLILGDGYTAAERGKFERDARRLVDVLFATSPFKERQRDINVWGLVSAGRAVGRRRGRRSSIYRRSPVGTTYDAFDSERYVLTFENKAFRDIAANAPYDVVEILVNSATYGGGGIYGLYSTVAADSAWAPYIFVHEFGHHIAGLADEYYTSDVAYLPAADRVEPWEPNATALLDPANAEVEGSGRRRARRCRRRGRRRSSSATPKEIQAAAPRDSRGEPARSRDGRAVPGAAAARDRSCCGSGPHAGKVGAFEGANYEARGFFRPQADCIMFTRDNVPFCAVCRRAIARILDLYSR